MADQPTCGQGLAEHSRLPLVLAELFDQSAEFVAAEQAVAAVLTGWVERDQGMLRQARGVAGPRS